MSKRKDSQGVKVVVRCRPFLESEKPQRCIRTDRNTASIFMKDPRNPLDEYEFGVDAAYDETATQQEIFHNEIESVLNSALDGYNTTIFAYGITGSGKTHTMQGNREHPGLIPQAVDRVLQLVNDAREAEKQAEGAAFTDTYSVHVSYIEIYNEKLFDLLDTKNQDLPIREDQNKNIFVPNVHQREIKSYTEFERLYTEGLKNRKVGPTWLNDQSSRSHAIIIITVKHKETVVPYRWITGKLHLIDLAGSEDNRKTGNKGKALTESSNINKSLFALGNVVNALNAGQHRIPYRDSKLTRLLQDSLGGNSQAIMIANISPCQHHYADTYNTLNFAVKSKQIMNRPKVNVSVWANDEERKQFEKTAATVYIEDADLKCKLEAWQEERNAVQQQRRLPSSSSNNNRAAINKRVAGIASRVANARFGATARGGDISSLTANAIKEIASEVTKQLRSQLISPLLRSKQVLDLETQERLERLERRFLDDTKFLASIENTIGFDPSTDSIDQSDADAAEQMNIDFMSNSPNNNMIGLGADADAEKVGSIGRKLAPNPTTASCSLSVDPMTATRVRSRNIDSNSSNNDSKTVASVPQKKRKRNSLNQSDSPSEQTAANEDTAVAATANEITASDKPKAKKQKADTGTPEFAAAIGRSATNSSSQQTTQQTALITKKMSDFTAEMTQNLAAIDKSAKTRTRKTTANNSLPMRTNRATAAAATQQQHDDKENRDVVEQRATLIRDSIVTTPVKASMKPETTPTTPANGNNGGDSVLFTPRTKLQLARDYLKLAKNSKQDEEKLNYYLQANQLVRSQKLVEKIERLQAKLNKQETNTNNTQQQTAPETTNTKKEDAEDEEKALATRRRTTTKIRSRVSKAPIKANVVSDEEDDEVIKTTKVAKSKSKTSKSKSSKSKLSDDDDSDSGDNSDSEYQSAESGSDYERRPTKTNRKSVAAKNQQESSDTTEATTRKLLNVFNSSDTSVLRQLVQIGPKRAEKIIDCRPYATLADVASVIGMNVDKIIESNKSIVESLS